jgi:hypothetical protein
VDASDVYKETLRCFQEPVILNEVIQRDPRRTAREDKSRIILAQSIIAVRPGPLDREICKKPAF